MIRYCLSPEVDNEALNDLFDASWPEHERSDVALVLERSLVYICAYDGEQLIGFVNVAWDGGVHAFLLDPTVHPAYRRRGIGRTLIQRAASAARERGLHWLHVDYEPHLQAFYAACGFEPTDAGVMRL